MFTKIIIGTCFACMFISGACASTKRNNFETTIDLLTGRNVMDNIVCIHGWQGYRVADIQDPKERCIVITRRFLSDKVKSKKICQQIGENLYLGIFHNPITKDLIRLAKEISEIDGTIKYLEQDFPELDHTLIHKAQDLSGVDCWTLSEMIHNIAKSLYSPEDYERFWDARISFIRYKKRTIRK